MTAAERPGSPRAALADVAPCLAAVLAGTRPAALTWRPEAMNRETVFVAMRDGTRS